MKDLRIIAGRNRGRKIKHPDVAEVRPTKDRIRESVFNMIAEALPGAEVMDLFAGSGSYGLEALSRGAKSAVFVEKNLICAETILQNARVLGEEDRSEILTREVESLGDIFSSWRDRFGVIFSDPPYNSNISKNILIMINQYDILLPSGLLVLEHLGAEELPDESGRLCLLKEKTYADITISIYRKR